MSKWVILFVVYAVREELMTARYNNFRVWLCHLHSNKNLLLKIFFSICDSILYLGRKTVTVLFNELV